MARKTKSNVVLFVKDLHALVNCRLASKSSGPRCCEKSKIKCLGIYERKFRANAFSSALQGKFNEE